MREKSKVYEAIRFEPATIRAVEAHLWADLRRDYATGGTGYDPGESPSWNNSVSGFWGNVRSGDVTWTLDDVSEWLADYRRPDVTSASLDFRAKSQVSMRFDGVRSVVSVSGDTRAAIEAVYEIFEGGVEAGTLAPSVVSERLPSAVRIFIGHGRSPVWRDLKDHLQDKHGFPVVAYEVGARAGYSIQEVLSGMVREASFALLVHTAEDAADGEDEVRARQNVVHETGLFQGALGFRRAIILREHGCESFSNVVGTTELRFDKGRIAEVFGDVVATIHREFGGRD